jgi:hypothetical protein
MSTLQQFVLAVVPRAIGKAMEKESRLWTIHCNRCGHESSVWDVGGIRYLAAGGKWKWRACWSCGRWGWLEVYKRQ